MNLDKLFFGSRVIKVDYIDKELADKKKIFGEFCSNKNILTIDKTLEPIEMTNTIIHEIFHMLNEEYKTDLSAKAEELVCNSLANGLCHTLYQNQELLDFLYKSLKKD